MSLYDHKAMNLITGSLNDALETLQFRHGTFISQKLKYVSEKLTNILMEAFDKGERDPDALTRAAVAGYILGDSLITPVQAMNSSP
jgi:hypothetical protein